MSKNFSKLCQRWATWVQCHQRTCHPHVHSFDTGIVGASDDCIQLALQCLLFTFHMGFFLKERKSILEKG